MKKLSLSLEQLRVDSFDTTPDARTLRGTVKAEQCTCPTNCSCPGCPTCDHTDCYQDTCVTCVDTCRNGGCTPNAPCWE